MRAVVQRVTQAEVSVDGESVGAIGPGLCVLVGIGSADTEQDAIQMAEKVIHLRVFEDADGKMNLGLSEVGGALLAISQFTLFGDVRKGRRPSFSAAMPPEVAAPLFERFCEECRERGVDVETGRFRQHMRDLLVNDGPVTILIDTEREF
jgi:D-tyrosyl-tRNA(Tyr) deacylase